jgi:hypothetical protein
MEKGLRPEVTREQMYAVIEHLQEAIEAMIDEEVEAEEPEDSAEIESMSKSEDYESDNEDEDKWDNIQKACWSGYKQVGMKEKNGRMVPNCVPVEKSIDSEEPIKKSIWGGSFLK